MSTLTWGPSLKVGFGDIDVQHRRLVELVNLLDAGVAAGHQRETIAEVLRELVRYTQLHFAFEEKLMERYGIVESDQHRDQHQRLTDDVVAYVHRFEAGEEGLEAELLDFLGAWLRGHILGADRELAARLIAAGADSAA